MSRNSNSTQTANRCSAPNNSDSYHQTAGSCAKEEKCKKGQLRLGVFFDGTGNDDHNAAEFSNVKKLFDVYPTVEYDPDPEIFEGVDSAYIRGVGSRSLSDTKHSGKPFTPDDYKGDGKSSGAFGSGGLARIDHMIYELQQALSVFKEQKGCLPKVVFFDVFGFSRGAVQARHYVNVLKQGFYQLDGIYDYQPKDFVISSLNVFDSVASFNMASVLKPNLFDSSTPEDYGYAFHIKSTWVEKIVHLIADDEYRQNFDGQFLIDRPDKDYPEAMTTKIIQEIPCLGAHSDIGGGYLPVAHGRNNNHLAKIYLNQMYDLAEDNGVPFKAKPGNSIWDIPKVLQKQYEDIQGFYEDHSKLTIAHKKFRERMAYLYDPNTNKHPPYLSLAQTTRAINANTAANVEQQKRIDALMVKYRNLDVNSRGLVAQRQSVLADVTRNRHEMEKRDKENEHYFDIEHSFRDLKSAFTGATADADYKAFLETSIDFHNTYVHKSHSGVTELERNDYDADGKRIPNYENKTELQKRINDGNAKLSQIKTDLATHRQHLKDLKNLSDQQMRQRYQSQIKVQRVGQYQYLKLREDEYDQTITKISKLLPKEYKLKAEIKDYQKQISTTEYAKRDVMGMDAEVDGSWIGDRYLHRDWYFKKHIDVPEILKEAELSFDDLLKSTHTLYKEASFQLGLPKKLENS